MTKSFIAVALLFAVTGLAQVTFPAVGNFMLTTNSQTNGVFRDRTITTYYGEQVILRGTNNGLVYELRTNIVERIESRRENFDGEKWVRSPMSVPPSLPPGSPGGPLPQNPNPHRIDQ